MNKDTLTKKLFNQPSLFQPVPSPSTSNPPVYPHFKPSAHNLDHEILKEKDDEEQDIDNSMNQSMDDSVDEYNDEEPQTITDEEGVARYLSTSKMSSRGPVNKEFTNKGSTPSGKPRLFVCSICTRAFARQEHLKRHERSHTKEKPFTCNICSRKFSRRDLLLRHSTKLHAGAADVIPRLRKRSIKHMKKEEIERMQREEEELRVKRMKAASASASITTESSNNTAVSQSSTITSLSSVSAKIQAPTPARVLQKIPEHPIESAVPSVQPIAPAPAPISATASSNPKSLLDRVLKSLTPCSLRNSSTATPVSSISSKSINSSSTVSHISKSSITRKKRVSSVSTSNSLILDQNDNDNTSNNNTINTQFANSNHSNPATTNNTTTATTNNNNNNNVIININNVNNIQMPLYPLNDNQLNSIADFSDINSSLATFENLNENDNHFDRFNELQSNAYNYYRRASFSAMSGVNYALTNPEPYASETVEFSTPQFNSLEDEQEKWLNSFSESNDPIDLPNHQTALTEIEQLNNFINKKVKPSQPQQQANNTNAPVRSNNAILNGYSFYEDDTLSITESLFKTRLGDHASPTKKNANPLPFKSNSPIMQDEILNVNTSNNRNINDSNSNNFNADNSKILKALFEKISNPNNTSNMNSNINVLDQMNLVQLEQMTNMGDSKKTSTNDNTNNNNDKHNPDFFDNFFDNNDNNVLEGVTKKVLSWQETLFNQPIADLEKLNEMHIAKAYGVPQGYSFYGGDEAGQMNRSNSNGLLGTYNDNSLSSEATISPVLLEPSCSTEHINLNEFDDADAMDIDVDMEDAKQQIKNAHGGFTHSHHQHHIHRKLSFEEQFNNSALSSYSQAFLFTDNISRLVNKGLSDYPFFGTPTPELLSNDVLNLYVDQFISKFLAHHPFIHKGVLNEYWLIKEAIELAMKNSISESESTIYTGSQIKVIRDENFIENFKVSIVCLPLLVTTIGAVVSNKKEDAAILYEISRRCIHVYLESRKNLRTCGGDTNSDCESATTSPLWLIQSLTLSVIYGLFADEEISLSVIIRQVHALNALIKSSGINELTVPNDIEKDYRLFIEYESTVRTIHMIFHVSTLLSTLYNIVPSLNISDLNIDLPSASLLWECSSAEEYYKLIENFDFHAKNFKEVIRELFKLDLSKFDSKTGLIDNKNFLLNHHVSEFGLICLQNGLHQLVYFKQLSIEKSKDDTMNNNVGKYIVEDIGYGMDISIERIRQVGQIWDLLVTACILYNRSSEVYNDCKILNHYLNLKLSSIVSLNKIKESVWLKSFSDINEQYIACFNYGDDELKDQKFQDELIHLIENSINILKLVFFNEDTSLMGTISPSFVLKNKTIKQLDDIYSTPPPTLLNDESISEREKESLENSYNYNSLNKINLNVLHKLSIDSQILFDVILIIVKFLTNYENFFKIRMKFNNLTNYTFLQHFEMNSSIFMSEKNTDGNTNTEEGEETLQKFDKVLFKYYLKFFKIFLNLEQFLKHNYNYEDFETGQEFNISMSHDDGKNEIDRVLRESHQKLCEEERTLNDIVSDELVVFHDRDLIMNELINFKLPFKFLKMGGFLFGFIYDKNFKFVNFKHLSDVLFHLRIFLESKDEYV